MLCFTEMGHNLNTRFCQNSLRTTEGQSDLAKKKVDYFDYVFKILTYFGHILQKLLYFRIFNNKYIEMAFKDIKIMLCRIFKKKKKSKKSPIFVIVTYENILTFQVSKPSPLANPIYA